MKLVTANILALTVIGLCTAPFAHAQGGGVEAKLKANEDSWAASMTQKDHGVAVVSGLVAADYHGVNSKGKIQNKEAMLKEMKADTDTTTEASNGHMDAHVYGANVATVVGTTTEKGKDKDGKAFSRTYAWVDTWVDRGGKWQCVGEAVTLVPGKR